MIDEIICSRFDEGMDVALREEGHLVQLVVVGGGNDHVGNILLGRVTGTLKGMEACFVDIGADRAGFLSTARRDPGGTEEAPHEGATVMVQVTKAPQAGKGAGLSRSIGLPGRFLVLTPSQPRIAVSRRITDEATRERLEALVSGIAEAAGGDVGFIVRTVAADADETALTEDAEALAQEWAGICMARDQAEAPALLHGEGAGLAEVLRDYAHENLRRVVVDEAGALEQAEAFFKTYLPDAATRIEMWQEADPVFEALGVEDEIDAALAPEVALPCGGSVVIEETHALTAIDVNSGRNTGRGGHEETIFATNMEAAEEIPRQLRLRNHGGLTVVDFIHMDDEDNAAKVLDVLMAGLKQDPAFIEATDFSALGLVELARRRGAGPLHEQLDRGENDTGQ